MTTLREKLQEMCKQDFQGRVRILFCNPKVGILRTEWFYLYAVPLIYFIDYLDCDVAGEDLFDKGACEEPEMQLTVAV